MIPLLDILMRLYNRRKLYGNSSHSFSHEDSAPAPRVSKQDVEGGLSHKSNLNKDFIFTNFVEGKSNQLGLAAASQVAENPGGSYNPLFIYGGVGLGKTHLMHAVGNALQARSSDAKVVYLHSERFVADMVKALQLNAINEFKRYYRSVDALLIDDIQFFAGKERSQEEFFHTFNALLEGGQQIIVTSDRYPKEISGLEERLKSRFGWGLTVAIEPPELETRVAILMRKADQAQVTLPHDAAFFIAQRIRSNVRELEGALKRVIANSQFTNKPISVELVREALKDLLALQDRLVSIDNIQRVVAEYYKIKISDLHSKRRSRSVARPRQVAMYMAKELTNHSLPEIGDSFGVVEGDQLSLTGTDLEVEIVARIQLEAAQGQGEITVPAKKFVDICRALPEGSLIDFKLDEQKVILKSGKSRFTLSTLAASEFPAVEEGSDQSWLKASFRTICR